MRATMHRLGSVAAGVVILTGLLLGILRLGVPPLASSYRAELVGLIAEGAGLDLQVSSLRVAFHGWQPELLLEGVRLRDSTPSAPQLDLRRLAVRLDLGASLRAGTLRIGGATLAGARLAVHVRADGSVGLSWWKDLDAEVDEGVGLGVFLTEGSLRLEDGELLWRDDRPGGLPLRSVGVSGTLHRAGEHLELEVNGHFIGGQGGGLMLRGSLVGDPEGSDGLSGELYLRLRGGDLGGALALQAGVGPAIRISGGVESWAEIQAGRLTGLLQRWQLEDLSVSTPAGAHWEAEALSALARWNLRAEGWDLDLWDLSLRRGGHSGPTSRASLAFDQGSAGEARLALGVDVLDLADLAAIAPVLAEARPYWARMVDGIRPAGVVRDLTVVARRATDAAWDWSVQADLDGVSAEPWGAWPGVRGLQGVLSADLHEGVVRFASGDLELRFPELFRQPLQATTFAGELAWQWSPEGAVLELWSPELRVENADLATRNAFALRFPLEGGDPFLLIESSFRDGNAATTGRYLPVGIMSPEVVSWLDGAILGGRIPAGQLHLQGQAATFPYREQQGRFEVDFEVEDLVLDYRPGWPRLEGIGAQVRFLNQGLEIQTDRGRVLQSRILQTDVRIPDLAHAPQLQVSARTEGPLADGLRVLHESPLAAQTGRYVEGMTARGDGRLTLELTLPLSAGPTEPIVAGVRWQGDASLVLADGGLTLERPSGSLRVAGGVVSSKGLQARVWGQPIELELATEDEGSKPLARLQARGRLGPETLARHYPSPAWKWLRGEAPWRLQIDFPHPSSAAETPTAFLLESELKGLELVLPAPLGKPAPAKRPFSLAGVLEPGSELRLNGRYGGFWASLALGRAREQGWRLLGGDIGSGAEAFPTRLVPGLRVRGELEELDAVGWGRWWRAQPDGVLGSAKSGPALVALDLGVKRLELGAVRCADARIRLGGANGGRWLSLEAPALAGRLALPEVGDDALIASLERLDLEALLKDRQTPSSRVTAGLDPSLLPPLQLTLADLRWGLAPVGRVEIHTKPIAQGMHFDSLRLEGPLVSLSGSGRWLAGGTALALEGHSEDLGKLLRSLGFVSALEAAPADATLTLGWDGAPYDPGIKGLDGRIEFRFGAGSLLDVDPGLGRVLGILNLGALRRRLSLDFRDLFDKGYPFDSIEGKVVLSGSTARTERLRIDAPAAEIEIQGETDLASQQLDQLVTVIPDLSSSLLVAGAVAGGPLVGAAVLVADQLVGKQVDKLAQYHYRVRGSWDDPVFEKIGGDADRAKVQPAGAAPEGSATETPANPFLSH